MGARYHLPNKMKSLDDLSPETQKWIKEHYDVMEGPIIFFTKIHECETQEEFRKIINPKMFMPKFIEETEWYWGNSRDGEPVVAGIVVEDIVDKDWSWVLLMRDERGDFRAIEVGVSLPTDYKASEILVEKMINILKSDKKIEPQGD